MVPFYHFNGVLGAKQNNYVYSSPHPTAKSKGEDDLVLHLENRDLCD